MSEQLLAEIDAAITEGHSLLARANNVGSSYMCIVLRARAWLRLEQHKRTRGFGGPRIPYMEGGRLDQAIADLETNILSRPESSSSWISDAIHFAGFLAVKAIILASEKEPYLAQKAIDKAKDWYTKVLKHPAATPLEQIHAVQLALFVFSSSDPATLCWKDQAADIALAQLPHACSRELNRESQQEIIRKDNADDLRKAHQDLAQRNGRRCEMRKRLLERISRPAKTRFANSRVSKTSRNLFLSKELQAQAKDGPIVIVNVSSVGSDAIIMTQSKLDAISLPDMKKNIPLLLQESLGRLRSSELTLPLERLRDAELLDPDTSRSKLLTWLWKTCVLPVIFKLRELGELVKTTNGDPPRVWWIGTGAAASLPFHAAGDINRMSSANLGPDDLEKELLSCMDWMTPSYAASIKSLQYARSRAADLILKDEPAILVVAMPTTPGHSSLLGVETERKAIEEANTGFQVTSFTHPSSEEVLSKLHSSSIAHFACHGMSHPTDLDASHILLQTKAPNNQPELNRLTVGDILDLTSHGESGSWLVYLSACATAQVKNQELGDENVHLASALQIAGFSHAVGSLWSTNDDACAEVARYFYEELSKYRVEDRKLAVAGALRRAIMKVRSECVDNPDYWAPFVHFGA
ncbi:TPR domain-containing protein [Fusarium denticulatum]|uniref:TPR domain-containing protein n=1 Tax=Fusarium denticulatum TaxID=48507 RepID=A0A8H5TBQ6_9HYPO|nr:TPR domain-containing protein [Fusarium denticulatum]